MTSGIAVELEGIKLPDRRLNERSRLIAEALAANPEASVNAACGGWNETHAAYEFFKNKRVTPEQILAPHRAATQRRMREHPVVLIVQDTTELDYTKHPPRDARCLNTETRLGLYEHVHLAVTPDKLCLGVVGSEFHDRAPETLGKTLARRTLPIEEKESYRWLKGYMLACQFVTSCPNTRIVSVADREGDIYDIFLESQEQWQDQLGADYLIRAQEDRSTPERDREAGPQAFHKVEAEVRSAPLFTTRTIELPETPKRAARTAHVEVRALTVAVKPPHARGRLPSITHNVVLAEEVHGPGDGTDVSWLLLTTLPIETIDDVLRIIDYYVARWAVEIYFRTLKSGCKVEDIQLETNHRLKNCLAFYKIIAWRIQHLTYLNRVSPETPCTEVFADSEWKSVWRVVLHQAIPPVPPTLSEFMKLLTRLGGYNNRATERPAGPQPIWIGLRRLNDLAEAWQAFGPET